MAWESRNRKRYFYRSQRVNGRVTKIYLGAGDVAQQAAEKDATAKATRARDQAELTALQATLAGLDQVTAEVETGVEVLLAGELLAMGYHQHKGEWRLRRE